MKNILTFIIPVRHPDNASDWNQLKKNLESTIKSISNQDCSGWKAIIVANKGSSLPLLPENFDVKYVDFPPNPLHEMNRENREIVYDAFRLDKGRRVLAGMLHAKDMGHVMIVDDDDFVSSKLTSFVKSHLDDNGWYISQGYIWSEGGKLLFKDNNFHHVCGTSHIVRSDLYNLPNLFKDATEKYIKEMLGSHMLIDERLKKNKTPLSELPFVGAIYRVGHANAHSKSQGLIKTIFFKRRLLKKPHEVMYKIINMRLLTVRISKDFFG